MLRWNKLIKYRILCNIRVQVLVYVGIILYSVYILLYINIVYVYSRLNSLYSVKKRIYFLLLKYLMYSIPSYSRKNVKYIV